MVTIDDFETRLVEIPKSLDSSELLHAENYVGRIREVSLIVSMYFRDLETAQTYATEQDFKAYDLGIVNVVRGEPAKNEPRSALLFKRENFGTSDFGSGLADALVMRESDRFAYYELGTGFRYVE